MGWPGPAQPEFSLDFLGFILDWTSPNKNQVGLRSGLTLLVVGPTQKSGFFILDSAQIGL